MKLAVCLYKFFPFGGLERDFLRIMTMCRDRGYEIDVYIMQWQGDIPDGFNVHIITPQGWSNHRKVASYIEQITPMLEQGDYDLVIGFNKIPGLDLYYAADACYIDKVKNQKSSFLQKFSKRFQVFSNNEQTVFSKQSKTVSLMISEIQRDLFKKHYDTPDERLIMLPPGIDKSRKRPENWQTIRQDFRQEFNIKEDEFILLMVGTGFKRKGVDRAIQGLASLPEPLRSKTKLFILGEGSPEPYQKLINQLKLQNQIIFFGGRNDVPRFLLGADLLLHPARKEAAGMVIIEAIIAGLPVLVTDVCGYAKHVTAAKAGQIVPSPFDQHQFGLQLTEMLQADRKSWSDNGIHYSNSEDLYSMPEKIVEIIKKMTK
jgi:UDP-glucose:(heptosyl)LPS alpha-1,3-glucosyltransferase